MVDTPGAQELSKLRDEIVGWMPDVCDIHRVTAVDDAFGGQTETEALVQSDVPCSLKSGAAQEQIMTIADRLTGLQLYTVTFPALTDVQVGDNIEVTTQDDLQLRIQAVMDPESWELERRTIGSTQGEQLA